MPVSDATRLQRATYRVWLWVGLAVLFGAVSWVLARPLAIVLPPVVVGILLAYLLNPVVGFLQRFRIPRLLGTLLSFALLLTVLTGIVRLLAPMLVQQVSTFVELLPDIVQRVSDQFTGWVAGFGLDLDLENQFDARAFGEQLQGLISDPNVRDTAMSVLGGLGGIVSGVFTVALALTAGPFIAAYILWDMPRLRGWATRIVPPQHRDEAIYVSRRLSDVVGGFIRGQLIVAVYVGVATSIGLALIGLPFWLVLGVVAGITNLVPLIGPFIAGVLGVMIAMFVDGIGLAITVVVVMTIVQQGDNQIVSPLVMGHTVRLHPLVVLLALIVGGVMYGVFGLIVAVPVVAAVNVLLGHFWRTRVPWADEEERPPPDLDQAGAGDGGPENVAAPT